MRYKEKAVIVPELESLPDIPKREWTDWQRETLWKYRHKDLNAVAKHIGRSRDAVNTQLKKLKAERGELTL
jgi:hypothetical protein